VENEVPVQAEDVNAEKVEEQIEGVVEG